jgi:hypothetical protein
MCCLLLLLLLLLLLVPLCVSVPACCQGYSEQADS